MQNALPVSIEGEQKISLTENANRSEHRRMYKTHREILDLWPSVQSVADDLNQYGPHRVHTGHISSFKSRSSLPPGYWPALIAGARARRISGVTFRALAEIAENEIAKAKTSKAKAA